MQGLNFSVAQTDGIVPSHARSIVIALLAAICMAIASTARGVASDKPFDCQFLLSLVNLIFSSVILMANKCTQGEDFLMPWWLIPEKDAVD